MTSANSETRFGKYPIGAAHPVFVIAEIGATHGGNPDRALALVEAAAKVGAQAVKLQTVDPDFSYRKGTPSYEIFTELKLSDEAIAKMAVLAERLDLVLLTTPGDFPSLEQAIRLNLPLLKISSGLMTNKPLVEAVARTGKPIIMSSGMAHLDEIARSVRFAREAGATQLAVLHCTSSYPSDDSIVNLRAIRTMEETLRLPVGYSDHTHDALACAAAVASGASLLEKHLALSEELAGPEAGTACDPAEFTRMVELVRRVERMRGTGIKAPAACEEEGRLLNRRRIMALRAIPRGTVITKDHIGLMRGRRDDVGLSPELYEEVIGTVAARDIDENEPFRLGMVLESKPRT